MENYGKLWKIIGQKVWETPLLAVWWFPAPPLLVSAFKMWPKSKNNDTKTHATEKSGVRMF